MFSKTDVVNLGLIRIGVEEIANIDGTDFKSVTCKRIYNHGLEAVLRGHKWNCAMRQLELTQSAETPSAYYDYQYQLPTTCLAVCGLQIRDAKWVRQGSLVLCSYTNPVMEYIKRIDNPAELDAGCRDVLVSRLALDLSYKFANKPSLRKDIREDLVRIIQPLAMHADALESGVVTQDEARGESSWMAARD